MWIYGFKFLHFCTDMKRFFSAIAVILLLISAILFFYMELPPSIEDQINILYIQNSKPAVFKTSSKFLSIGLDDVVIAQKFKNFDMNNEKLITMIRHLSPGYFRIGGNLEDMLYFSLKNETDETVTNFYRTYSNDVTNYEYLPNVTLTAPNWLKLTNLSKNAHMDLFFGLNALQRFPNGTWDYRNAELMIKFSNFNNLDVNWELGNEPNSFKHKFNQEVNATQMAKDFQTLRNILNKYQKYKNSLLVGPDVTRPEDNHKESEIYLKDFVKNAKNIVNKITFHQYYMNGRTAQPKDFLDPKIYDLLKFQINKVKEITNSSGKPIWLGETASAYGGGAPNLSDRFIGSFIWLDKLGLAAKLGVEVIIRQSIFHGNYSLLDINYDPNPDWWVSLLYKKLVGSTVVPSYSVVNDKIRLYVHCHRNETLKSIVILGINVDKNPAKIKIEGLIPIKFVPLYVYAFELQSIDLFSKNVYLNGVLLKMLPGSKIPKILPKRMMIRPSVIIPPFSVVFWVTSEVNVRACPGLN